jgi:hypothetical protein
VFDSHDICKERFCLFLDESGDHSMINFDQSNPFFCLAGCIVDTEKYYDEIHKPIEDFKKKWLGTTNVILHSTDIRKRKNAFVFLNDNTLSGSFYGELDTLIAQLPFVVIAACINKQKHLSKYGSLAYHPYHLSLEFIMERYFYFLGSRSNLGHFVAESRGRQEDKKLQAHFELVKRAGTQYIKRGSAFDCITDLRFFKKTDYLGGLDIADLVAYPIARQISKPDQFYKPYQIVEQKFYRDTTGKVNGYGLKIFP